MFLEDQAMWNTEINGSTAYVKERKHFEEFCHSTLQTKRQVVDMAAEAIAKEKKAKIESDKKAAQIRRLESQDRQAEEAMKYEAVQEEYRNAFLSIGIDLSVLTAQEALAETKKKIDIKANLGARKIDVEKQVEELQAREAAAHVEKQNMQMFSGTLTNRTLKKKEEELDNFRRQATRARMAFVALEDELQPAFFGVQHIAKKVLGLKVTSLEPSNLNWLFDEVLLRLAQLMEQWKHVHTRANQRMKDKVSAGVRAGMRRASTNELYRLLDSSSMTTGVSRRPSAKQAVRTLNDGTVVDVRGNLLTDKAQDLPRRHSSVSLDKAPARQGSFRKLLNRGNFFDHELDQNARKMNKASPYNVRVKTSVEYVRGSGAGGLYLLLLRGGRLPPLFPFMFLRRVCWSLMFYARHVGNGVLETVDMLLNRQRPDARIHTLHDITANIRTYMHFLLCSATLQHAPVGNKASHVRRNATSRRLSRCK